MGRIAEGLIKSFGAELVQAAEQFSGDLPDELLADFPTPEQLVEQGYDPQYILYVGAQNFAGVFADTIVPLEPFQDYDAVVDRAEARYQPDEPPHSAVTGSFFWTWAWFDLQFGPDQETVGRCLLELMHSMQAPPEMLQPLENYCDSRMGIYELCGLDADHIRLRELVTGDELLCHNPTGYEGRQGELWYVRLVPPVSDEFDYHVAVTTPYVLTEASAADWTAFLNKHLREGIPPREALRDLLKYGSESVNWMEFVAHACERFQPDAILLAGLPDDPVNTRCCEDG